MHADSVKSYGPIEPNEEAIKAEVFHRGPVVCSMASIDDFDYQYHGGVYVDPANHTDVNHDVEIVGWGEDEEGTPYWRVRYACVFCLLCARPFLAGCKYVELSKLA